MLMIKIAPLFGGGTGTFFFFKSRLLNTIVQTPTKNNSHVEMPSVINLKKMGAVGRCGYIWQDSSFTPSQRTEEKRGENLENSSQPQLRIQHTWEEHATWLSLNISELVTQATRTHKQGALAFMALCSELRGLHPEGPAQPCEPAEGKCGWKL